MTIKPEDTLFEFPCRFPIKVMGAQHEAFEITVLQIIRRHAPDLGEGAVVTRPSKGGNYLAITITIQAQSREQLDNIYRELSAHELVKMAF